MDCIVHGVEKSQTPLSDFHFTFFGGSVVKNPPANAGAAGDTASTPGSGRSPGGGPGNPLQYSCLENPMDRGAWRATVYGVEQSWTGLNDLVCTHVLIQQYLSPSYMLGAYNYGCKRRSL